MAVPDSQHLDGHSTSPRLNARGLWAGGIVNAVVAVLVVIVGGFIARHILGIAVLAPRATGDFGGASTVVYTAMAAAKSHSDARGRLRRTVGMAGRARHSSAFAHARWSASSPGLSRPTSCSPGSPRAAGGAVLARADWAWRCLAVLASMLTYTGAACQLAGFVLERLRSQPRLRCSWRRRL